MKKSLPKSGRRISSSALKKLTNTRSAPSTANGPLEAVLLRKIDAWWRAANYLSVGQTYLYDNPLLKKPLKIEHVKPRLLGHWGTSPGLSFIYVHLNRLINEQDANIIYIAGPGHGGPALNAQAHTWGKEPIPKFTPTVTPDAAGMQTLLQAVFLRQEVCQATMRPACRKSPHEGGELGYALLHAFGAAFDNPELIVACVIGDGEAETCPLEGSWKGNKFLNPVP